MERKGTEQTNERATSPKGWIQTSNKVASPFKGPRILRWGNYMPIVAWIGDRQTSFFSSSFFLLCLPEPTLLGQRKMSPLWRSERCKRLLD